ncbi:metallohydrolase [Desulfosporosinus sp. SB140]|uniref:metallohydrolase n=1 Tax=Desulfosporosinus paludis TaxID=3115649 RepID=UPI00388E221B
MSVSTITYFPVDNGGMTLIKLNDADNTTILTDMYIRGAADDENDETFDVSAALRKQLDQDQDVNPYVDVFLLTHNDDDHIKGIQNHFYLGDPAEYEKPKSGEEPKIIMKEIWCSSRFWKRASDSNKLCDDAKAFNKEMKRRVKLFEANKSVQSAGNRALIIGKDPNGKTDNIEQIVKDIDTTFTKINGKELSHKVSVKVLGPIPQQEGEKDEDYEKKNRGSVILQISIFEGQYNNEILVTGDAEVFVWECLWEKFSNLLSNLRYDVLSAPHHCSWHSISNDSQSSNDDPQISDSAKKSLSQAKEGAFIIASSKTIKNDDNDPPSYAAKKEYLTIVSKDHFLCTEEYPSSLNIEPIVFNLTNVGPQLKAKKSNAKLTTAAISATGEAFPHG